MIDELHAPDIPVFNEVLTIIQGIDEWFQYIRACGQVKQDKSIVDSVSKINSSIAFVNNANLQNITVKCKTRFFAEIFAMCAKFHHEGYGIDYIGEIISNTMKCVEGNDEFLFCLSSFVYKYICKIDQFEIYVRYYDKSVFKYVEKRINVRFDMSIRQLCHQMSCYLAVSDTMQQIIFRNKILKNNMTVLKCGLMPGNCIHLVRIKNDETNKIKVVVHCIMTGEQGVQSINVCMNRTDTICMVKKKINHCITMQTSNTMNQLARTVCGQRVFSDGKFLSDDFIVYETSISELKVLTNIYMEFFNGNTRDFMLKPVSTEGSFHKQRIV